MPDASGPPQGSLPPQGSPPPQGTLLGFDFGLSRIGVAVGQTLTRTANPLTTIRHHAEPEWPAIAKLVQEWRPAAMVVGLPLDRNGEETDMSRAARSFGAALGTRFGRPVLYADERLSSHAAGAQFVEARANGQARRKHAAGLDALAASIILGNWLQSQPG